MQNLYKDSQYLIYLESFLTENRKKRIEDVLLNRTKHFTVAIEDIFQLHNTSAVMRSCEVFGVQELHVVEEKFGKRIDTEIAMGAQKWVDIFRFQTQNNCINHIKSKGYQIIATTPHENDCFLQDFDIFKPSALFFGTERNGLSEDVLTKADGFLKIPMVGFTESLNISVSVAIVLQELTVKLRNSSVKWQLTEEELLEKRIDWTRKSIKDIDFITDKYLNYTF